MPQLLGPQKTRDPWIDLLRFFAAFMVVIDHGRNSFFVAYGDLPHEFHGPPAFLLFVVTRLGHEAVVVFFVLSGYLVGGRAIELVVDGRFDVGPYIRDRICRIYPALLLSLLFSSGVAALCQNAQLSPVSILTHLVGLQGVIGGVSPQNPVLWTLSYEIWFYVLCGAVCTALSRWRAGRDNLVPFLVGIVALSPLLMLESHYLVIWTLGASLPFLAKVRSPSIPRIFVALVALTAGVALLQLKSESVSVTAAWKDFVPPMVLSDFVLAGALCVLFRELKVLRMPDALSTVAGRLSDFSYTMYLVHYPTFAVFKQFIFPQPFASVDVPSVLVLAGTSFAAVVVSYCLYFTAEKHTGTFRRKFDFFVGTNPSASDNRDDRPLKRAG